MEKISTVRSGSGYTKYYRYGQTVRPVPFLEELAAKGWQLGKLTMRRDAEMDMQMDAGAYTLEELKRSQPQLAYGADCRFTLEACLGEHRAQIHFSDTSAVVYLVTAEEDFELE